MRDVKSIGTGDWIMGNLGSALGCSSRQLRVEVRLLCFLASS